METLNEILNYIARTNLFNFVIFLSIIIFLCKKINVSKKIEDAKVEVENVINDSTNAKTLSETNLSDIEKSLSGIEDEISSIIKKSEENASLVGEKILEDAKKNALIIQDNSQKSIENSRNILKNDLIKRASIASVEIAKSHILEELSINQGLHDKLIDESIESIEGSQL
jgi:F0F1-type ATP synthase membrane subunit b/b'